MICLLLRFYKKSIRYCIGSLGCFNSNSLVISWKNGRSLFVSIYDNERKCYFTPYYLFICLNCSSITQVLLIKSIKFYIIKK